ncbi:SH3 domain-containing protein [Elizabethkingia anophelis]|uniref:SH3 domain-containing protein n=1 Tax=Elizabethkingia anophelis TaxID=1117645 RepID=UPI00083FF24B|nr:SH3 domain-containing protein [Elizabethkingia anophelis]OCW73219.1 hypothetical protein A4G24_16215 [Elizabethkingia anophelis]
MDNINYIKNINFLSKKINSIISPLETNHQFYKYFKMVGSIQELTNITTNHSVHNNIIEISKSLKDINKLHSLHSSLNKDLATILDSFDYWGEIIKISFYKEFQEINNIEEINILIDKLNSDNKNTKSNIEEAKKNPLELFNTIFIATKSYVDANPSIKYSAIFMIWFISTIIIPITIANFGQNNTPSIQIVNNYANNITIASVDTESLSLKNHPRDKSKNIHFLKKNDKVQVLKDSIKWCLVIKANTIESGWVRKEYLTFSK